MSGDILLKRISGFANSQMQQYKIVGTAGCDDVYFFAFTPVGGDAVLTTLTNSDGSDALAYDETGDSTYYEGETYTGSFSEIQISSGKVKIELSSQ